MSDNNDCEQNIKKKNLKRKIEQANLESNMNFEEEINNLKSLSDKLKKKVSTLENKNKSLWKHNRMLEDAVNDLLDRFEEYDYYNENEIIDSNNSNNTSEYFKEFTIDLDNLDSLDKIKDVIIEEMNNELKNNYRKKNNKKKKTTHHDFQKLELISNKNETTHKYNTRSKKNKIAENENLEKNKNSKNKNSKNKKYKSKNKKNNNNDTNNDNNIGNNTENDIEIIQNTNTLNNINNDKNNKSNKILSNTTPKNNKIHISKKMIIDEDYEDDEDSEYIEDYDESKNNSESESETEFDENLIKIEPHIVKLLSESYPDKLEEIKTTGIIPESFIKNLEQLIDPEKYIGQYCDENNISKKKKKKIIKQGMKYIHLNNKDMDEKTELDFFLSSNDNLKKNIISSLQTLNTMQVDDIPYKFKILSSKMELHSKNIAIHKAKQLNNTEPGTGEYYKLKNWMDTLLNIPWGQYKYINLHNSMISGYLSNARYTMDKVIYGQNETKDVIIQIISKMISNPSKCGNVFAVHGPPGVGKTTIIKDGMSKALNLPFAFISLGGATDSSYLDGHGYTYEGSIPGKIVDVISKVKCLNPIIYFDELDKISKTSKGEEIVNLLIHLTDPSQNTLFQDKYLGNVSMDLSKSIFVFSFNDITRVSPILLDRMNLIYVKGFTHEEKQIITKKYLLPELLETYKLYDDPKTGKLINKNTKEIEDTDSTTINNLNDTKHDNNSNNIITKDNSNDTKTDNNPNDAMEVDTTEKDKSNNEDNSVEQKSNKQINDEKENDETFKKEPNLIFTNENLDYIIKYQESKGKEEGVRQIKRRIEKICAQINIVKITEGKWEKSIHSILDKVEEFKNDKLSWPLELTNDTIDILLKADDSTIKFSKPPFGMYL